MSWRSRTYDELPALAVRGEELRRSLRITTIAWMYGIVWMSCTMGSHVPVFSRMLGFTDWDFGLFAAVPFIGTLAQLAASIQIERTGLKKYQFLFCGAAHRLLYIALGLIPLVFWPLPSRAAVWAMILIWLTSAIFNSMSTPAWMLWMGDLIPKRVRGRYFANRALYCRPIQFIVAIALGVVLDMTTRSGEGVHDAVAAEQPVLLWVICVIFAISGVFGLIDVLVFYRVREVLPPTGKPRPPAVRLEHLGPVPTAFLGPLRYELRAIGSVLWQTLCLPLRGVARLASRHSPARRPLYCFASLGEPPAPILGKVGFAARAVASFVWQMLLEPVVKDRVFRHYVGYGATIQFAMTLPGYFFWRNGMENLGFSRLAMNMLFLVISPILGLIGAQAWGRLIDRWGRRPVLFISTSLVMLSSVPWFLAYREMGAPQWVLDAANWILHGVGWLIGRPDWFSFTPQMPVGAYLCVVCATLFGGIGWTGIALAQTAVVLGFSDGHGRSKYVAASAVLIAIGGVLGGLAGGSVATWLKDYAWNAHPLLVGPFAWNNWHATFALSILFRFLSLLWLVHMPDPGSRNVRDMMRSMGDGVSHAVAGWLLFPVRILGWGRAEDKQRKPR